MTQTTSPLTQDQVNSYRQDGYLIARGFFPKENVAAWLQHFVKLLQDEDSGPRGQQNRTSGIRVWLDDQLDPATVKPMISEPLASALIQLMGPDVEFLSQKIVYKAARTSHPTAWHQDRPYWLGTEKLSIWIPLDVATKQNGCLRVAPGTHHSLVEHEHDEKKKEGFSETLPQSEIDKAEASAIAAEVEPGDAVFFHDLVIHSSYPNINGKDRRALIPTYRSGAIRDDSTIWKKAFLVAGRSLNGAVSL